MALAADLPSMADPPFACPPEAPSVPPLPIVTVISLPFPPSVNDLLRRTRDGMRSSNEYKIWKTCADKFCLYTGEWRRAQKIRGNFTAEVILDHRERKRAIAAGRRFDVDNRGKAVLDWCQSRELIRDDCDCDYVGIGWGDAPHGCRITLREVL